MTFRTLPAALAAILAVGAGQAAEPTVDFNRDVRPILSDACFNCHGPDARTRKADLRLDTPDAFTDPTVVVSGKSAKSGLIQRVVSKDPGEVMPPAKFDKKLTPQQIETLRKWVDQGAKYEGHWAYQPIKRPAPPTGTKHPVDGFIRVELAAHGLKPAPEADRVTLIRRLSFDLIGLPPTPAEADAFVNDKSPDAYEKLVDRLLASPHYGERMAMFWLDLVRYADSVGYHGDQPVSVSPFRDWVIRAFNENVRFDRFTTEQLAGDLLPNPTTEQKVAAGYNRLGMMSAEGGVQPKEYLAKYAAERVRNLSGAWLGVTIGCAECHDHKFDPFTTKDFYELEAFFTDFQEKGIYDGSNFGPYLPVFTADQEKEHDALLARIVALKGKKSPPTAVVTGAAALDAAAREAAALERKRDAMVSGARKTVAVVAAPPRTIRVLPRGNWMDDSGAVVEPGYPEALLTKPVAKTAGRRTRLDLAKWVVSPDNPLTARTLANRLWKLYFGAGLSRKMDDLGSQGEWPSHPQLLDYLAGRLIDSGWDVKATIRLLVTSETYRRSSAAPKEITDKDPFNKWLARQARFRLDAELVRDNALAVSGLLARTLGGPSAKPYQPPGYWSYLNFPTREWQNDTGEGLYRRGLYTHWQRQYLHPSLAAFDAPTREECVAERVRSNTPLQALVLLNDPIYVEAARACAERAVKAPAKTDAERVDWMVREALSRPAKDAERDVLLGLLQKHRGQYARDTVAAEALLKVGAKPVAKDVPAAELAAWTSVARTILNLHSAITRN